jgi:signal transduction histidine kinase
MKSKEIEQLREENRRLLLQIEKLNEKLLESESFKSHFLSNITNEIVNPFASVMGLSQEIMDMTKNECQEASRLASLIFSEAFALDFQLKNIFVAARLEAGEEIPQPSIIQLPDLVSEAVKKIQHEAHQKQIAIHTHLDKEAETFVSDRDKLLLILLNLLSNAIHFSKDKSEVTIRLFREKENLVVEVRDRGIGMTQEEKERIFDRFHRANPRIQSVTPGSGLGLAVVEGLLFILDGHTEVITAPGKGTTIRVVLPEMDAEATPHGEELFFDDDNPEESF